MKIKKSIILNLIRIVSILSCLSPSMAISNDNSTLTSGTKVSSEHISYENLPTALSSLPLIAGIDHPDPGRNAYEIIEFTLKRNRILRLYAQGKGNRSKMHDYGGIEDGTTGQLIWKMHFLSTVHAGGIIKNRKVDRLLPLKAGTYRLHFKTDRPKQSGRQISAELDSFNRGIWLFDVTKHHMGLLDSFWEEAVYPGEFGWLDAELNKLIPEMEKFGTDALMVVTDGKVIFKYGNITNIIRSHSMRKSLLSGLYGIYAANGKIDPNATIEHLGISESSPLTLQEKQATVQDLLKARSGVYIPAAAESSLMRKSRPKRGRHKPGNFWYYNNWDFNVLGTIFRQETDQDLYQAFKNDIADPIGMQDFILDRQSYYYEKKYSLHPAYPFLISARDMAKFGQLFLQKGLWKNKQIIPEKWIADSTVSYSQTKRPGIGYGYMWWILTEDANGLQKGCYFADGYGGQRLYVIPHINSVVVHRINIKIPGTNLIFSELATDAVIKRIMKAYTGKKEIREKSIIREKRAVTLEKQLLDYYGRSPKYYGKSFQRFRAVFWICAALFTSGIVIWIIIYFLRKFYSRFQAQEGTALKGRRFPVILKWIAATGGLICSIYIVVILTIPYAFEYVAMVGIPADLNLHQRILIHVPKFSVLLTLILFMANIWVWANRYWTIFERIHFVLITIAAAIFASLAYHLNLIILT